MADRETRLVVSEALAALPEEQRVPIVLVDVEGYSVADTARMLGIAEGTVKSRCARGRAKLAKVLGHLRNPSADANVPDGGIETAREPRFLGGPMTGIDRRGDAPMGPPWPVDVLADLHAGVLDAALADQLWPRVRQDPEAVAVLDALDATRAETERPGRRAIGPRCRPHLAARLDAAIAVEAVTRFGTPIQAPQRIAAAPTAHRTGARSGASTKKKTQPAAGLGGRALWWPRRPSPSP